MNLCDSWGCMTRAVRIFLVCHRALRSALCLVGSLKYPAVPELLSELFQGNNIILVFGKGSEMALCFEPQDP